MSRIGDVEHHTNQRRGRGDGLSCRCRWCEGSGQPGKREQKDLAGHTSISPMVLFVAMLCVPQVSIETPIACCKVSPTRLTGLPMPST